MTDDVDRILQPKKYQPHTGLMKHVITADDFQKIIGHCAGGYEERGASYEEYPEYFKPLFDIIESKEFLKIDTITIYMEPKK